jgi:hypothetical protein
MLAKTHAATNQSQLSEKTFDPEGPPTGRICVSKLQKK